ncbi:serglycin [Arapaima gigas]
MGILVRTLLALAVLHCLAERVLGAPTKARYHWVECKPGGINSNCVTKKGPWFEIRTPQKAGKPENIEKIQDTLDPEDQSGDGSGGRELSNEVDERYQWPKDEQKLESFTTEGSAEQEHGSGDYDYSNFIFPSKVHLEKGGPVEKELQEENLIL